MWTTSPIGVEVRWLPLRSKIVFKLSLEKPMKFPLRRIMVQTFYQTTWLFFSPPPKKKKVDPSDVLWTLGHWHHCRRLYCCSLDSTSSTFFLDKSRSRIRSLNSAWFNRTIDNLFSQNEGHGMMKTCWVILLPHFIFYFNLTMYGWSRNW